MQRLISRALESRGNIFQIAIVATLIALGTNLLASWIVIRSSVRPQLIWMSAAALILVGFGFFIRALLHHRTSSKCIDAMLLLEEESKAPFRVNDYEFSQDISRVLRAVFVENEALKRTWQTEIFREPKEAAGDVKPNAKPETSGKDEPTYFAVIKREADPERDFVQPILLLEAVEFCFLRYLSLHLSEYFESGEHSASKVREIEREHIPDMLMRNRILALLTTPIEDRAIFIKSGVNKNPPKGEIHSIWGSDGAVYERFHLVLPSNTTIARAKAGTISLKHPRFSISLSAEYYGLNVNLPTYFSKLYVTSEDRKFSPRLVKVRIDASLTSRAFLYVRDWEYYQWIDSFLDYCEEKFSFANFIQRIDWTSTETSIRAGLIQKRRAQRQANKQREHRGPLSEDPAKDRQNIRD